jgi:SnoaL-like domain
MRRETAAGTARTGTGPQPHTLERRSFLRGAGAALSASLASAAMVAVPGSADAASARAAGQIDAQRSSRPDRLALLQDTQEIVTLHRRYGAALNEERYEDMVDLFADESQVYFNGGIFAGKRRGVRRLYVEHFGARASEPALTLTPVHRLLLDVPDAREIIEVSADRRAATARFGCLMQVEAALDLRGARACSLAEMARQQGQGMVCWWEGGEFENTYLREAGVWKIQRLVYSATASGLARVHAMAQAIAGRGGQRPRGMTAFSKVYPQEPRGPDALIS